jgi:hypothetical protein
MLHGSGLAGANSNILPRARPRQGESRRQRPAVTLQTPPMTTPPESLHHGNPQPKPTHREHRHRRPSLGLQRAASRRIPILLAPTPGGSVGAARGPAPRVPVRRKGTRLVRPKHPWGPPTLDNRNRACRTRGVKRLRGGTMETRATTGGGEATAQSQPHIAGHNDAAAARRWPRHHPPRRSPGSWLADPVVAEIGTTELGRSRSTDTRRERRRERDCWNERSERSLAL